MNQPQDELHAWLALAGGGMASRLRARRLLAHFGSPLEIFQAGAGQAREALNGEDCSVTFAALAPLAVVADRTRQWLDANPTHYVVPLGDIRYPQALLESPAPPLLIHCKGNLECLTRPAVGVVGSRHATPAGVQMARRFSAELCALGIEVVSGLAVGIDAAAHEAVLQTFGSASTIAVVAYGLDDVYPRAHRLLFDRIAEQGLLLSEHPLGTAALPSFFPQRNRIIAGLSCAVVVVEATLRSGSLITARLASEAGRDVFAVPGHLSSPQAAGCNQLIKAGAGLLEHVSDIVEAQPWAFNEAVQNAVQPRRRRRPVPHQADRGGISLARGTDSVTFGTGSTHVRDGAVHVLSPELSGASWKRVQRLLRAQPCDLTELAVAAGGSHAEMSRTLLIAELEGMVARLPGGLYQWCGSP